VIKTNKVVNCTGAWANDITNMVIRKPTDFPYLILKLLFLKVGLSIPLVAMKHAYVTTERIPGIENMPNVRDHDASVYLKLQVGLHNK